MGLPGLNQYYAEDKVSCSRTQCSATGEALTINPSISSQAHHYTPHYQYCNIHIFLPPVYHNGKLYCDIVEGKVLRLLRTQHSYRSIQKVLKSMGHAFNLSSIKTISNNVGLQDKMSNSSEVGPNLENILNFKTLLHNLMSISTMSPNFRTIPSVVTEISAG